MPRAAAARPVQNGPSRGSATARRSVPNRACVPSGNTASSAPAPRGAGQRGATRPRLTTGSGLTGSWHRATRMPGSVIHAWRASGQPRRGTGGGAGVMSGGVANVELDRLLNRRLTGMGTTIFAEMSALALTTGSVNLGQGFPDADGPAEIAAAAAAAIMEAGEPVPARPGHPRAAARGGRAPEAVLRAGPGSGHRGAGHRGRHRGDRGRADRADGAGRRGDRVRAVLRLLRRLRGHGRRRPGAGHAAPARVPARPGRAARRHHPADPAHPAEHPAQPHRRGVQPRRAGRDRRGGLRARPAGGVRRGLRAPGLRRASTCRSPPCPACASAR